MIGALNRAFPIYYGRGFRRFNTVNDPVHVIGQTFWRAASTLMLIAVLMLCASPAVHAHDPLVVDVEVTIDGDTLSLTIEVKQWALLSVLGERRSLFADRAELERFRPRLSTYLATRMSLLANGDPMALISAPDQPDAAAKASASGEPPDPASFTLETRIATSPGSTVKMSLLIDAFSELGATAAIIDHVSVRGLRVDTLSRTVRPGECIDFTLRDAGRMGVTTGVQQGGSSWDFVRLGFLHIVPEGLDHILFVLGLFLLSPKLKPLLTQITAFTVAHSLTLGLAMAGVLSLPPRVVEPLIALSIAVVAIENIYWRQVRPWRWMVVFAFGLVHGLGFASALKDMKLPPGSILPPLISFNVGVELGQLSVIALAALVTVWFWKRPWYHRYIVIPASGLIACVGLFWAIQRALGYGIEP